MICGELLAPDAFLIAFDNLPCSSNAVMFMNIQGKITTRESWKQIFLHVTLSLSLKGGAWISLASPARVVVGLKCYTPIRDPGPRRKSTGRPSNNTGALSHRRRRSALMPLPQMASPVGSLPAFPGYHPRAPLVTF